MAWSAQMTAQSHLETFYDRHWEHTDTAADPNIAAKGDLVLRLLPEGVRTLADVGCGDGYLTHRLSERCEVTAIDLSAVALERAKARASRVARVIQASADAIPLPDGAVDLVFSSEMLEHLPAGVLQGAAVEMSRVAGRWLLLSVPHREGLRRRFAQCPRCRHEFHVYGHLHSFDAPALDRLFPAFERVATEITGPLETPFCDPIERVRQRVLGKWWLWDKLRLTCPACGETAFEKRRLGPLRRAAVRGLDAATAVWRVAAKRSPEPYWLVSLYRRRA